MTLQSRTSGRPFRPIPCSNALNVSTLLLLLHLLSRRQNNPPLESALPLRIILSEHYKGCNRLIATSTLRLPPRLSAFHLCSPLSVANIPLSRSMAIKGFHQRNFYKHFRWDFGILSIRVTRPSFENRCSQFPFIRFSIRSSIIPSLLTFWRSSQHFYMRPRISI